MEISYDGQFWQIYVKLNDQNIQHLKEKKELQENNTSIKIDDAYIVPEPLWDVGNQTKILWINISNQLFELFLDICKNPNGRACIDRIWTSLSVELLHNTVLFR
ncbi:MAG: hypothetical protein ACD_80C00164G0003 [uncultured bacterium (gcode 4)]|uniref:Uncharacterized protein n=1 Tax=uncultured bacterium (gcode 4) TaxID=1234023 RepID=K1X3W1_9BACT|nr:MAG: hypothetical protein ACD_80C00164G0003 [uncultured bacterium (gcode 4)]